MSFESSPSSIDAIARGRQTVLTRANQLLSVDNPVPLQERFDALPAITGMLMASLEELKVAEEELREQNAALAERRDESEHELVHYRQLFQMLPVPVLITDRFSAIREVNQAASRMFAREANRLERKPLVSMVHADYRDAFRRQLSRVADMDEPTRWQLIFNRLGDVPVVVHATVQAMPDLGAAEGTHGTMLVWMLQPEADMQPVAIE
jgi:PAS domain S-box-containing protein